MSTLEPGPYELINMDVLRAMPIDDVVRILIDEINVLKQTIIIEDHLRQSNPALKDAYDRYQIIKELSIG